MKKWLGCCAGTTSLVLLLVALLLWVGLPAAIEYIASLEVEMVFDLQMDEWYPFERWNLTVTDIDATSADFAIVETGKSFTLSLDALYSLPEGYVIRLVTIQDEVVRIQLFAPVQEE